MGEPFGCWAGWSCPSSARMGVRRIIYEPYLRWLGWAWTPTMAIGSGCRVHLRAEELPPGRLIVSVSRHLVAVIHCVIDDTHDCSRNGSRCVYGTSPARKTPVTFSAAGIVQEQLQPLFGLNVAKPKISAR